MQLPANRSSRRASKSVLCFFEVNSHKVSGFHGTLGLNCIHDRCVRIDNPIQLRLRSSALQTSANRDPQALSQRAGEKRKERIARCFSDRLMEANVMWHETFGA